MKKIWIKAICAALALLLLAGCAPAPAEPTDATQSADVPTFTALSCADTLKAVPGTYTLRITAESDVFLDGLKDNPDLIYVSYGFGETAASSVKLVSEGEIEVTFEAAPADDDVLLLDAVSNDLPYVIVSADGMKSGSPGLCTIALDYPSASIDTNVPRGAKTLSFSVLLSDSVFSQDVSGDDFSLGAAFSSMQISQVERKSDTEILVTLSGEMQEAQDGIPYTEGTVTLLPSATQSQIKIQTEAALSTPAAYFSEYPAVSSDGKSEKLVISLENCAFASDVSAEHFTLVGDADGLSITSAALQGDGSLSLVLHETGSAEQQRDTLAILIAADATNAGQDLGVDFHLERETLTAQVEDLAVVGGQTVLDVSVTAARGVTFASAPEAEEIVLGETLKDATVSGVALESDTRLRLSITTKNEDLKGDYIGVGVIELPDDCLSGAAGSSFAYVAITTDTAPDTSLSVPAAESGSLIALADFNIDQMLDNTLTSLCDSAKEGLTSLAKNTATSVFKNFVLPFLGIEIDDRSEELKKLEEVMKKLDDMSVQIDKMEKTIQNLIDATESNAFKEQMRDVQSSVLKLKPRIAGFQGGLSALAELEIGSDKYLEELKILTGDINASQGIDFHSETYALGEKLLSDAAGTADGAIKAHYDRIMTMKNWEQQTYDERERFYLYAIGTYYQAALFDKLALQYTIESTSSSVSKKTAEAHMKELNLQIQNVEKIAAQYQVHRLDPQYDRNLRANVILKKNVLKTTYDTNNRLLTDAEAYTLIQKKLDRGQSQWGREVWQNGEGIFTLDSANLLTEAQANTIFKAGGKSTLLDELKSAGFTIADGCPNTVLLSDVQIMKFFTRTSSSSKWYSFAIYYRLFDSQVSQQRSRLFSITSNTKTKDPFDFSEQRTLSGSRFQANGVITAAQVTTVANDPSLYIS